MAYDFSQTLRNSKVVTKYVEKRQYMTLHCCTIQANKTAIEKHHENAQSNTLSTVYKNQQSPNISGMNEVQDWGRKTP